MKRIIEFRDMGELENLSAYDNLKTLDLVNDYFLKKALSRCTNGKVLDVGCGTGKMLRQIIGDYELHGIDVNERILEYAKSQGGKIEYKAGDSSDLPYENGQFDLVMCHSVLHHIENPGKTISEIIRVAKPHGSIFIRDLCRPDSEEILQKYFLGFLASHYDDVNKRLFEDSLKSSFTFPEWESLLPNNMKTRKILFYNIAERHSMEETLESKLEELEFIVKRLSEPIGR